MLRRKYSTSPQTGTDGSGRELRHALLRLDIPRKARMDFAYAALVGTTEADDTGTGITATGITGTGLTGTGNHETGAACAVTFTVWRTDGNDARRLIFKDRRQAVGRSVASASKQASAKAAQQWKEVRLDLAAGNEVLLEFSTSVSQLESAQTQRCNEKIEAYFAAPVITAPVTAAQVADAQVADALGHGRPRPNLVLISLDTLRAASMSAYGYERDTTPGLARVFGEDGIIVDRVYTQQASTLGSHAAIFSGMLPPCVVDLDQWPPLIAPQAPLLAELLGEAGYRTAAFTEDAWLSGRVGFARGFDLYHEQKGVESGDTDGFIKSTLDAGLDWIERHSDQAFFIFLHSYQVHTPYHAPAKYQNLFVSVDKLDGEHAEHTVPAAKKKESLHTGGGPFDNEGGGSPSANRGGGDGYGRSTSSDDSGGDEYGHSASGGGSGSGRNPSGSREARAAIRDRDEYDREIAYTDAEITRFLAALDRLPLAAETVVVVTSDHGEEFGEHGRQYHGTNVTDEVLHVPLMIKAGSLLPAGLRRNGPMALIDLSPTLLELLGLEAPAVMQGRSMLEHLRRVTPAAQRPLYSEARSPIAFTYSGRDPTWMPPSLAITRWPLRLVRIQTAQGPRHSLFDLTADPHEKTDLWQSRGGEVSDLLHNFDIYQSSCDRIRRTLWQGAGTRVPGAPGAPGLPSIDKAQEEKLRALGYLDTAPGQENR